jgi:predicted transcriptional regulator
MTQATTIKLLKKTRKWMLAKEISKILDISNANTSLKKLYEQGEILRRIFNKRGRICYQYKLK